METFIPLVKEFGLGAGIFLGIVVTFGLWIPKFAGWAGNKIVEPLVTAFVETVRKIGATQEALGTALVKLEGAVETIAANQRATNESLGKVAAWTLTHDSGMRQAISEEMVKLWKEQQQRRGQRGE